MIDWHIRLLLALAWLAGIGFVLFGTVEIPASSDTRFKLYIFGVLLPAIAIYVLYHPVLEFFMQGRTPGKRMAGVRVTTQDGQVPDLMAHLIRNLLRLVDSLPTGYVVGLVSTLVTDKAVRIGDIAAGTLLIYDSDARGTHMDVANLNPASVSRYGLARVELVQDLLDRWDSLTEDRRRELGARLLASLEPELEPEEEGAALRAQLQAALDAGGDA